MGVTIAQRPKRRKLITIYRKSIPREENSKYKGPEAGVCLTCPKSNKKENIAGTHKGRKEWRKVRAER